MASATTPFDLQTPQQIGPDVQVWRDLLVDPDWELRAAAARSLGAIVRRPDTRGALLRALSDDNWQVTQAVIGSLAGGTPCIAVHLLPFLTHSEPEVRTATAKALGRLGNPIALDALSAATGDVEVEVRLAAAKAFASVSVLEGWA